MDEHEKSDSRVLPTSPPNKATRVAAEGGEGRGLAEGNTDDPTRPGRGAGAGVPSGLDRVRDVARKDKEARFSALVHPGFPGDFVPWIPGSLVVWSRAASARSNWWAPVSKRAVNPGLRVP